MRILYVDHAPVIGGAEFSLLELIETLDRNYEPAVACTNTCQEFVRMLRATQARVFLTRMPRMRGIGSLASLATGVNELRNVINQFKPDIVHSNTVRAHIATALAGRVCGVKVVWTIRDFFFPLWLYRLLVGMVDRVIFVSASIEQAYGKSNKTSLVLNGIVPPKLDASDERLRIRREYSIPDTVPLVASVGQLVPWKGQDMFLKAASALTNMIPEIRFIIVGDGPAEYRKRLMDLASVDGLNGNVVFTGFRPDALSCMCASDLVVHTSLQPEPFGRVLIEAMALGKPMIASPLGGPAEIIEDGVSGLLVSPKDVDALSSSIAQVLTDHSLRERLSSGGLVRFTKLFDQENETSAIQDIYQSLEKSTCKSGT